MVNWLWCASACHAGSVQVGSSFAFLCVVCGCVRVRGYGLLDADLPTDLCVTIAIIETCVVQARSWLQTPLPGSSQVLYCCRLTSSIWLWQVLGVVLLFGVPVLFTFAITTPLLESIIVCYITCYNSSIACVQKAA
jgi:hypothetical protein